MKCQKQTLARQVEEAVGAVQIESALPATLETVASKQQRPFQPGWGPLVEIGKRYGINRTTMFALARSGAIRTGRVGRRRVVFIDSMESLPDRLASKEAQS